MLSKYHRQITERALGAHVSPRALRIVVRANLWQDNLPYHIRHDHFHFDSNQFAQSYEYMESQRAKIQPALERGDDKTAWRAFGRLTHAAQDFYAHSDYIPRWLARFNGGTRPSAAEVDPLSPDLIRHPDLRSGRLYYPFELLAYVMPVRKFILQLLPADSHAHMNMDAPHISPHFDYVFHAAVKRTKMEIEKTILILPPNLQQLFTDN